MSELLEQLAQHGLQALTADAERRGFDRGAATRPLDVKLFVRDGSAYLGLGDGQHTRDAVTFSDFVVSQADAGELIGVLRDELTAAEGMLG